jgi:hypothetical protein
LSIPPGTGVVVGIGDIIYIQSVDLNF